MNKVRISTIISIVIFHFSLDVCSQIKSNIYLNEGYWMPKLLLDSLKQNKENSGPGLSQSFLESIWPIQSIYIKNNKVELKPFIAENSTPVLLSQPKIINGTKIYEVKSKIIYGYNDLGQQRRLNYFKDAVYFLEIENDHLFLKIKSSDSIHNKTIEFNNKLNDSIYILKPEKAIQLINIAGKYNLMSSEGVLINKDAQLFYNGKIDNCIFKKFQIEKTDISDDSFKVMYNIVSFSNDTNIKQFYAINISRKPQFMIELMEFLNTKNGQIIVKGVKYRFLSQQ